ncbi:hypothetical protein [Flavobacterium sp.]|uniref:hypothetical protein n=1 Tax=Flavobacterium sp. TaxID=239 RepID=UPI003753A967
MKKTLFLCLILSLTQVGFSQEKKTSSVEKSIFGIQIGTLGVWAHNEFKLANEFSLRSELGVNFGLIGGEIHNGTTLISAPSFSLEPRWYYNLSERASKNKNISKNSADFLTLGIHYFPGVNSTKFNVISQISFIPKWGIKRTLGDHFTYEAGIGLGYVKYLDKNYSSNKNLIGDLHLRLGYTF